MLVLGSTGSGKSTLLRNLIAQDIARGDGLLFIDPHGADAEAVLDLVPKNRANQVAYFNVADTDCPVGINFLTGLDPNARALRADNILSAMRAIWSESWGPRLEHILRFALAALMEVPGTTLLDLPPLLTSDTFRRDILAKVTDKLTLDFFHNEMERWRETVRDENVQSTLNKVTGFLFNPIVRGIISNADAKFSFEHALARRRIVIANLSKGRIGATSAFLMGSMLLAALQSATMARQRVLEETSAEMRDLRLDPRSPEAQALLDERMPAFHVIVDEAQNLGSSVIAELAAEARKYAVSVTIGTQILAALPTLVQESLLGNVGSLIAFRVSSRDSEVVAPAFNSLNRDFEPASLLELSRGEAMVRVFGAQGVQRVQMPPPPAGYKTGETVRKQSRRHYGRAVR